MRIRLHSHTGKSVEKFFLDTNGPIGVLRMFRFVRCVRIDLCMYFDANAVASVDVDEILSAL